MSGRVFTEFYRAEQSPIYRSVWEPRTTHEPFSIPPREPFVADAACEDAIDLVRRHRDAKTLYEHERRLRNDAERELTATGYWGLLGPREFGGGNASYRQFFSFLTRMASLEPTIAGLLGIHSCLGPLNALRYFGSAEQRARLLPRLLSGEQQGIFCLTERAAGSDVTQIKTRVERENNRLYLTGEKIFISNAAPGRLAAVVCRAEDRPLLLIVKIPSHESEQFQFVDYGLHALLHTANRGLKFNRLPVPLENLVQTDSASVDGIALAYHGLNRGRVALAANAAGSMRILLAGMMSWIGYRRTYGEPLAQRELVRQRLARLASLIVGVDALVDWCAHWLDGGYRGELEGIVAKTFASAALKEAAIDLALKTHGGRSFLHGHRVGDHLYDFLAPTIYEGEGDVLSLAFWRSLVKPQLSQPQPFSQAMSLHTDRSEPTTFGRIALACPASLVHLERFARRELRKQGTLMARIVREKGAAVGEYQSRLLSQARRVQQAVVLGVTANYAARQENVVVRLAGQLLCRTLWAELNQRSPIAMNESLSEEVASHVLAGHFPLQEARGDEPILLPYDPS